MTSGVIPPQKRAYVQALMDRRNEFVRQAEGLQARMDALHAKIAAFDDEIADAVG